MTEHDVAPTEAVREKRIAGSSPLDGHGEPLDRSIGAILGVSHARVQCYAIRMASELFLGEAVSGEILRRLMSKASHRNIAKVLELVGDEIIEGTA